MSFWKRENSSAADVAKKNAQIEEQRRAFAEQIRLKNERIEREKQEQRERDRRFEEKFQKDLREEANPISPKHGSPNPISRNNRQEPEHFKRTISDSRRDFRRGSENIVDLDASEVPGLGGISVEQHPRTESRTSKFVSSPPMVPKKPHLNVENSPPRRDKIPRTPNNARPPLENNFHQNFDDGRIGDYKEMMRLKRDNKEKARDFHTTQHGQSVHRGEMRKSQQVRTRVDISVDEVPLSGRRGMNDRNRETRKPKSFISGTLNDLLSQKPPRSIRNTEQRILEPPLEMSPTGSQRNSHHYNQQQHQRHGRHLQHPDDFYSNETNSSQYSPRPNYSNNAAETPPNVRSNMRRRGDNLEEDMQDIRNLARMMGGGRDNHPHTKPPRPENNRRQNNNNNNNNRQRQQQPRQRRQEQQQRKPTFEDYERSQSRNNYNNDGYNEMNSGRDSMDDFMDDYDSPASRNNREGRNGRHGIDEPMDVNSELRMLTQNLGALKKSQKEIRKDRRSRLKQAGHEAMKDQAKLRREKGEQNQRALKAAANANKAKQRSSEFEGMTKAERIAAARNKFSKKTRIPSEKPITRTESRNSPTSKNNPNGRNPRKQPPSRLDAPNNLELEMDSYETNNNSHRNQPNRRRQQQQQRPQQRPQSDYGVSPSENIADLQRINNLIGSPGFENDDHFSPSKHSPSPKNNKRTNNFMQMNHNVQHINHANSSLISSPPIRNNNNVQFPSPKHGKSPILISPKKGSDTINICNVSLHRLFNGEHLEAFPQDDMGPEIIGMSVWVPLERIMGDSHTHGTGYKTAYEPPLSARSLEGFSEMKDLSMISPVMR